MGPRRSIAEVKKMASVLFIFFDSEMIDRRIAKDGTIRFRNNEFDFIDFSKRLFLLFHLGIDKLIES
jgi:hypothetical protein